MAPPPSHLHTEKERENETNLGFSASVWHRFSIVSELPPPSHPSHRFHPPSVHPAGSTFREFHGRGMLGIFLQKCGFQWSFNDATPSSSPSSSSSFPARFNYFGTWRRLLFFLSFFFLSSFSFFFFFGLFCFPHLPPGGVNVNRTSLLTHCKHKTKKERRRRRRKKKKKKRRRRRRRRRRKRRRRSGDTGVGDVVR